MCHVLETYKILVEIPDRKGPLERPRNRRDGNIKMDLQEVGMDWCDMAQDKDTWRVFAKAVMNPRIPQNAGKILE
jgi:hypothetical protein